MPVYFWGAVSVQCSDYAVHMLLDIHSLHAHNMFLCQMMWVSSQWHILDIFILILTECVFFFSLSSPFDWYTVHIVVLINQRTKWKVSAKTKLYPLSALGFCKWKLLYVYVICLTVYHKYSKASHGQLLYSPLSKSQSKSLPVPVTNWSSLDHTQGSIFWCIQNITIQCKFSRNFSPIERNYTHCTMNFNWFTSFL